MQLKCARNISQGRRMEDQSWSFVCPNKRTDLSLFSAQRCHVYDFPYFRCPDRQGVEGKNSWQHQHGNTSPTCCISFRCFIVSQKLQTPPLRAEAGALVLCGGGLPQPQPYSQGHGQKCKIKRIIPCCILDIQSIPKLSKVWFVHVCPNSHLLTSVRWKRLEKACLLAKPMMSSIRHRHTTPTSR